jgi:hypothetical protein
VRDGVDGEAGSPLYLGTQPSCTALADVGRITRGIEVEPLGASRARLTIAIEFEGHGIGRLLVPLLVEREARKEMPRNLDTLKQRLEAAA